jgi:hypothetical protein
LFFRCIVIEDDRLGHLPSGDAIKDRAPVIPLSWLDPRVNNPELTGRIHAAGRGGYIEIAWTLEPLEPHPQGREFRLRWRERNRPPVLPPSHTGFGTQLIQKNLAAEFEGEVELEYHPDRVECTICAPAEGWD